VSLTVPEAARRIDRNPETVRRWIREGRLAAHRVGTQHFVEEEDLRRAVAPARPSLALPAAWKRTHLGAPMPDVVAAVARSRAAH